MRYGTIPMVRETGGLKDTVEAYNEYEKTGTGFSFRNYNFDIGEMPNMIHYAMHVYYDDRKSWNDMAIRCMQKNYSWDNSAKEYEKIYDRLLKK